MSSQDLARRTRCEIAIAGVDITEDIRPYLLSMVYSDYESDESDDLQLRLQDRDGLWLKGWLNEAIEGAAAAKLKIAARIIRENWASDGKDAVLSCGSFELDDVNYSDPPSVITLKSVALPFSSDIRHTKKSKLWASRRLKGIAQEMAGAAGLTLVYEASADPFYQQIEQRKTSDIEFLSKLCEDAGISLKLCGEKLVLFERAVYEAKPPVLILKYKGGGYINCSISSSSAKSRYGSCRVGYRDPKKGWIEGIAYDRDYDGSKTSQRLDIDQKVENREEAEQIARVRLSLANSFAKTASFTIPGNPYIAAGNTVRLDDFGGFDGIYMVSCAMHEVGDDGYETTLKLRRALNADEHESTVAAG